MRASNLTKWGEFLLWVRAYSTGFIAASSLALADYGWWPMAYGVCVLLVSTCLTPLLRALGWRGLAGRTGDGRSTGPTPQEVERALRVGLDAGVSLPEAVRHLHQTRGWDLMVLYPAVEKVSGLTQNEAIRVAVLATS